MTSKEALLKLCFKYLPTIDEMHLTLDEEDEALLNCILKDLDILEDFIELFKGEDLDGWIEFDFNYTREPEDSIDNYNGFISLLKRIRNYLEGVKK